MRDCTERTETVEVGSNVLAGSDQKKILSASKAMSAKERMWDNPFGDGKAAERIVKIITAKLS
jgi:UDP-N-acetylglucosamine 2-epimerase (non-hydrolysing)